MQVAAPTNVDEAKTQGWHMVCVLFPTNSNELKELIEQLKSYCGETCTTSFGRTGSRLNPDGLEALWIRGFDWKAGFETVIFAYHSHYQLAEFCREMKRRHMPHLILDKKQKPDENYLTLVRHQIQGMPL